MIIQRVCERNVHWGYLARMPLHLRPGMEPLRSVLSRIEAHFESDLHDASVQRLTEFLIRNPRPERGSLR